MMTNFPLRGRRSELTVYATTCTGGAEAAFARCPATPPSPSDGHALRRTARTSCGARAARALGMNPGRTSAVGHEVQAQGRADKTRYEWTETDRLGGEASGCTKERPSTARTEILLQEALRMRFDQAIISRVLYASAARDFESLGLGYLWVERCPAPQHPGRRNRQPRALMRMLAQKWRWTRRRRPRRENQPPGYVNTYMESRGPRRLGFTDGRACERDIEHILGRSPSRQWLVNPDELTSS